MPERSFLEVAANHRAAMSVFARATERAERRQMPGVLLINSGVAYSVFNSATLSSEAPGAEGPLERRISIAQVHFAVRDLPWSFWVCEGLVGEQARRGAPELFARHGLRWLSESPGMVADHLRPPQRPLPSLEILPVSDERTRSDFARVANAVFDLPLPVARRIYGSPGIWEAGMRGWVGYLDGRPITTSATVTAAGVVGLYSVGTLAEFRRQGYAEATLRHALEDACRRSGLVRTILQSTPGGLSLYQRLGYRVVTRFTVYIAPR